MRALCLVCSGSRLTISSDASAAVYGELLKEEGKEKGRQRENKRERGKEEGSSPGLCFRDLVYIFPLQWLLPFIDFTYKYRHTTTA